MRLSTWVVLVPALIVGVALAVANRARVVVGFDPFDAADPIRAVEAPLFLVMFTCLLLGILVGGLVAWWAGAPVRRQVRLHAREVRRLQEALPVPAAQNVVGQTASPQTVSASGAASGAAAKPAA